jgi:hypothetical protein
MTINSSQSNTYGQSDNLAYGQIQLTSGVKAYGAWAESSDQYGAASAHYSCTPPAIYNNPPTGYHNMGTSQYPIVGSYAEEDGGNTYVNILFAVPEGQMVRIHTWTVT